MSDKKVIATIPGIVRRTLVDPDSGESREYYVGSVRSDLAKSLTFVPVKEESRKTYLQEDSQAGYQRPGSPTRMRMFAKYVKENPLSVVPPIVLSSRDNWSFNGKSEYGSLDIYGPAAIVDGQHRMGGYVFLYESEGTARDVDLIVLADLSLSEETEEFLAINDTQKGVPRSLNIMLGGSDEALIAVELDDSDASPFKDRITQITKSKGDLFSLAAVAKNVKRTFDHGAFEDLDIDTRLDVMIQYWELIADAFPEEWSEMDSVPMQFKLLETTGLIAWSLAATDILGPAFDPGTKAMNWDMVRAKIDLLAAEGVLDWRKDGEFQGLTGEVGGAKIHKKMQQILSLGLHEEP
jgi:DNA sulfur modification protein DndB